MIQNAINCKKPSNKIEVANEALNKRSFKADGALKYMLVQPDVTQTMK